MKNALLSIALAVSVAACAASPEYAAPEVLASALPQVLAADLAPERFSRLLYRP